MRVNEGGPEVGSRRTVPRIVSERPSARADGRTDGRTIFNLSLSSPFKDPERQSSGRRRRGRRSANCTGSLQQKVNYPINILALPRDSMQSFLNSLPPIFEAARKEAHPGNAPEEAEEAEDEEVQVLHAPPPSPQPSLPPSFFPPPPNRNFLVREENSVFTPPHQARTIKL